MPGMQRALDGFAAAELAEAHMSRAISNLMLCVIAFSLGSAVARYQGSTFWLKADMESING